MGDMSLDRSAELAHLPPASPPRNHGHTPAAWVTVVVVVLGSLVTSVALVLGEVWLAWVGAGVIVLGLLVGRVMAMLGFGQPRPGDKDADRKHADPAHAERPDADRPHSDRPQSDLPHSDRPHTERTAP